ncbi:MAG: DUF983 domain-containing protein [Aurantimonas coralicida]|uniref:DUF983 domain-containing protein n=1 Tax=Aurantimonas TaxID=182269 RepID=UPI000C3A3824|nr:DUF983 domain-containing protein [Aurantimonas coralicida]MAP18906.1 hypothetical protein [Aurantimonas sp.]MAY28848.1 hypothetical protein [Aurantimonas sp.]MCC4299284.1 DUF983 domain-containing protein [Aurantimonas coralicida]MCD1642317.1 DUF983 domain-containing protein [Aurantimonas coralicida]MDE0921635.1 DUF983 domain-containing protein [Aurantimonas coralicida]
MNSVTMHADAEARANSAEGDRPLWPALVNGFRCHCPNCGEGKLFRSYLRSVDDCSVCGQEIHHHRADDLPPYLTIFIVGHIVVALFMGIEASYDLSMWTHLAMWVPVTLVLSLALLQPLKGATIGLQWSLRLGGFGTEDEADRVG